MVTILESVGAATPPRLLWDCGNSRSFDAATPGCWWIANKSISSDAATPPRLLKDCEHFGAFGTATPLRELSFEKR